MDEGPEEGRDARSPLPLKIFDVEKDGAMTDLRLRSKILAAEHQAAGTSGGVRGERGDERVE